MHLLIRTKQKTDGIGDQMISVSWDSTLNHWVHHEKDINVVWGVNNEKVIYQQEPLYPAFSCKKINSIPAKAGPVIGILSSKKTNLPFVGNLDTFRRLSSYVHSQGGIVFIFTLEDYLSDSIRGYIHDSSRQQWMRASFPLPDFVYNRIAYRSDEENPNFHSFIQVLTERGIPFFNRGFFSKWQTYLSFKNHQLLAPHLPETKLLTSINDLEHFLKCHRTIIVKPISSSQGKGIFSLTKQENDQVHYFSNKGHQTFENLEEMQEIHPLSTNLYLMQPLVNRTEYKGRPYDFRILVQKISDKWKATGVGVRLAGKGKLTTHVPAGGEILSIDDVPIQFDLIEQICEVAGSALEQVYRPVGEFSMDLGIDQSDHYWVFEVNSKPMVFDESMIQMKATEQFYCYALDVTGFSAFKHIHSTYHSY
ncbi:YheC/YheD family protein [Alkalihalobacillus sp. AL-G]|uniref:YheC/YheD family endospore coat-associated protein n=1 Tax=Alkalihalobacillus sp. AL-G TaxID=2926399 RepID=UPI002729CE4A|nr:YheC/YheD family protein [Alkalihalobacillus sp. AL-G]WLD94044.1 YheC/YheD family protein [Alkalihalobacillus sp. AL-G]